MSAKPLFEIGRLVMTQGVAALDLDMSTLLELVHRHAAGDFGTICDEDRFANIAAVENGLRVIAAYQLGQTKLWIITEADRSSTTILLPEDY